MALPGITIRGGVATGGAFPKGRGATIAVEVETAQFNESLRQFVENFRVDVQRLVESEAFQLEGAIKARTPVRTGRLRASIHTVIYGRSGGYSYNAGGKVFDGTLSVYPANSLEALVGTNVEYAPYIEAGHSRKAPSGMFRVSIAERREYFMQRIANALSNP